VYLDTHVVVWLYMGHVERFPRAARDRLEAQPLVISPMVALEVQYLFEVERITQGAEEIIGDLRSRVGLRVADASLERIAQHARALSWTRDPFDRLIAAQPAADATPLLTADRTILDHLPEAVWD
jgi:PIN domain nuclease of toxin-antitoxin system